MSYSQELLKDFMEKTGKNVRETAAFLGMLQPNFSRVRKGELRFTNEQLVTLAEALEIRPEIVLIKSKWINRNQQKKEKLG
ncbi:MAG: hypothetical protein HLX50_14405 [Alteromonadaceae bacterium]|nr:hypothetical protein [Alteromonadaceae bacterium]